MVKQSHSVVLPRYTSDIGYHQRDHKSISSYSIVGDVHIGPIGIGSTVVPDNWAYTQASAPSRRARGFRPPTNWTMLAGNVTGFAYENLYPISGAPPGSQRYYKYVGNGLGGGIPVPVIPNASTVGGVLILSARDLNGLNRAYTEARLKIKDQHLDLGSAVAESKELGALLAKTAVKGIKAFSHIKHGRWAQAIEALGAPVSKASAKRIAKGRGYLEFQFAWRPFANDLYGLQEQWKEKAQSNAQIFTVKRTISVDVPLSAFWSSAATPMKIKGFGKQTYRVQYYFRVKDADLHLQSQLGLTNPLTIAWEVTPYSFMIDWFLPVGNFLSSLDATLGVEFVAGCELIRLTSKTSLSFSHMNGFQPIPRGTSEIYAMQRRVLPTFGMPLPYIKSPFSSTHVVEAVALLRQLK